LEGENVGTHFGGWRWVTSSYPEFSPWASPIFVALTFGPKPSQKEGRPTNEQLMGTPRGQKEAGGDHQLRNPREFPFPSFGNAPIFVINLIFASKNQVIFKREIAH
jgi:hypothetical protein